jgi:hypothetical protein
MARVTFEVGDLLVCTQERYSLLGHGGLKHVEVGTLALYESLGAKIGTVPRAVVRVLSPLEALAYSQSSFLSPEAGVLYDVRIEDWEVYIPAG